jgi:aryl-alcohol dehydrogenase-like predicted oxidoreductase
VVIASKVGMRLGEGPNRIGLNRKTIMEEIEGTLKRLQTDHVDIYYAHQLDVTTPIDETMRAFDDLVRQGKVRYLGCSNFPAWRLCKALWTSDIRGLARFDCVQPRYNMLERGIERGLVPLCIEEGVGMNPYAPLAGGLLSGKYRWGQEPGENTRYHGVTQYRDWYWNEANFQAIERLRTVAEDNGHGLAELALAWMLQKPGMTSPIFSARTVEQLEQNLASMDATLSEDEIAACEALSPPAP